ncbi:MAG: DUF4212 domain-containing protein [Phaeodactylibacter sp.]|nr:DUF4212 domain-containing protein [Phaeodactylibacter sp.]MCB9289509.1 DUF4212 domain-containing protein [Lewinellaceae bacterium]
MEKKKYWRKKIQYLLVLLSLWFTVSILCSIVFVHQLNAFKLGGFPLGFWFAMQGSMIIFVLLIFVYVWLMNRLDNAFRAQNR